MQKVEYLKRKYVEWENKSGSGKTSQKGLFGLPRRSYDTCKVLKYLENRE